MMIGESSGGMGGGPENQLHGGGQLAFSRRLPSYLVFRALALTDLAIITETFLIFNLAYTEKLLFPNIMLEVASTTGDSGPFRRRREDLQSIGKNLRPWGKYHLALYGSGAVWYAVFWAWECFSPLSPRFR